MCDEEMMMSLTLIVRSTEKNKPRNALKSLGDGRDAYEIESVKWNFSIETTTETEKDATVQAKFGHFRYAPIKSYNNRKFEMNSTSVAVVPNFDRLLLVCA